MKTPFLATLAFAAGIGTVSAASRISESDAEFFASGDFDGDGRTDSLIIDKAAGVLRLGYQTAEETWTWVPARPAGAVPVTATAVGKFTNPMRDEIAVTSPVANSVLVHPADDVNAAGAPLIRFPLVGPDALAPLGLPGFGARDQMVAGSAVDPAASPYVLAAFDPPGGAPDFLPQDAVLRQGQPILLKTGINTHAAFLADGFGTLEFRVYDGVPAALPILVSAGVAVGAHHASAHFDTASPLAQVLFWTPGAPELRVRPVVEPAADTFELDAEVVHSLSANISQVIVLDDPDGPRLLVLFDEGLSAGVFAFDGSTPPALIVVLDPAAGERFRAATLAGGGSFVLSSSPEASPRSQTFRPYRRDSPGSYTPLAAALLPAVTTNAGRTNVILFSDPPFVSDTPHPLAALHAGDWTRSVALDGGNVTAVAETFAGTAEGLDDPLVVNLGPVVPGATESLANQFEPFLSISSLRAAYDSLELEPSIAPMPGTFDKAQQLVFSAPAGAVASFRVGLEPWQIWAGSPIWLTEDVTVSYYGTDGIRNSALRAARYTFSKDEPLLDSDHDGVPDFVEIEKGLDPRAGPDSDGDGWGDDTELLAGTNPGDPNDPVRPAAPAVLPLPPRAANAGVNLTVTLRSWRGGAPDPTLAPEPGTRVDAIDTLASLLATRVIPGSIPAGDSVVIENLAVPRGTRYLSLTTAPSWNRQENFGPVLFASQSIALVPAPAPPPPLEIAYVPGGGTPADEAAAWIAALAAAEAAQSPRDIAATLSPVDTLVALLVEKKTDDILVARGADGGKPLSLFDTGLTDAGARRVTPGQLAALELPGPADEPAWLLSALHLAIDLGVKDEPGGADVQALRLLAADIFEQFDGVWQPPSPANPGGITAAFPAPIDLLRSLARGEALPQGYLDVSSLAPAQISDAQAAVAALLALPSPRPDATLTLAALADSWRDDCTVLDDGGALVALVDANGDPWRFQGSIALPTGALLEVRGFTDRPPPPPACAASTLEVISATVLTLPGGAIADSDGDGLGDDWERVFFGNLDPDGFGDFDGDTLSNAQEYLDGTDPAETAAAGANPALAPSFAILPVPRLEVDFNAEGLLELTWECSDEARTRLIYSLEGNPSLEGDWPELSASPAVLPDGRLRFTIDPENAERYYFRVRVTLP